MNSLVTPGRNASCPCGSGRKYKHCCLSRDAAVGRSAVLASRSPRLVAVNGEIQRGLGHHQRGELAEAEAIYRQVLEVDPEQADALHLLGLLAHQTGNQEAAEALMGQAIARKPGVPHFHNNLGAVMLALGRPAEGMEHFREALRLKPDYVDALNNLGNLLRDEGKVNEAIEHFREILRLRPGYAEGHSILGASLQLNGDLEEAIEQYRLALQLKPEFAEAHSNLGVALRDRGKSVEALAEYQEAIRINPNYAEAHNNLGVALQESGDFPSAIEEYRHAVRLQFNYPEAHNNLGVALQDQGDIPAAMEQYRQALEVKPNYAEALNNLGLLLQSRGELEEAEASLRRAIQINPNYVDAYNNLANVLRDEGNLVGAIEQYRHTLTLKPDYVEAHNNLGVALQDVGDLVGATAQYREALRFRPHYVNAHNNLMHQLQHMCAWSELEQLWEETRGYIQTEPTAIVPPFTVVAMPSSGEEQLQCARNWVANRLRRMAQVRAGLGFAFRKHQREKLRIGYLSADYHEHATAYLIAELFELHDRERFEVIAYSIGRADESAMRARLVAGCDRFVDLGAHSFVAAAQAIYEDGIDILVDLKGYTQGCRTEILALRPAPIQVNYLGYPGTMGAEFMDYVLTDRFITPEEEEANFTEAVVYLPECYQVNDRKREIAERTPTRAECGLPAEGFVYCSFNNAYKLTPGMFELWMRLLRETPGSVLWVLESNPWMAENLREEAGKRGVDPARLVFAPRLPLAEHLARHRLADLFLDTLPYNAHTTASDALWVGVPVLTCVGRTFASRVAGSLVHAVGMDEMITSTLEGYEAKALELAHQPATLRRLREQLAGQRDEAPLFASERFTRHLETAYATMWDQLPAAPAEPVQINAYSGRSTTNYNIMVVEPPGYAHSMALWDVGRLLLFSLESLGYSASLKINQLDAGATNIVLGYHLLADSAFMNSYRCILYQLEQLGDGDDAWLHINPSSLGILRRAQQVWDYSPENIAFLQEKGLSNVQLLPIGFHERLQTIPSIEQDIDVLFYGSLNDRRKKILEELGSSCRVEAIFGVYGEQRDDYIARSKIVLNMHLYQAQILEQARISYLLNNGRFVISENSIRNPYEGFLVTAPYDELVQTCLHYLESDASRQRMAIEGLNRFRERPMMDYVSAILRQEEIHRSVNHNPEVQETRLVG